MLVSTNSQHKFHGAILAETLVNPLSQRVVRRASGPEHQRGDLDSLNAFSSDWDTVPDSDDDETSIFPQQEEEAAPEFVVQNILAIAFIALLGLSFSNILIKLLFVTYALLSAAFRYTIVAILVIIIFALFT